MKFLLDQDVFAVTARFLSDKGRNVLPFQPDLEKGLQKEIDGHGGISVLHLRHARLTRFQRCRKLRLRQMFAETLFAQLLRKRASRLDVLHVRLGQIQEVCH
jgi:hypothetical protein